jgi:hypothetical protein
MDGMVKRTKMRKKRLFKKITMIPIKTQLVVQEVKTLAKGQNTSLTMKIQERTSAMIT